MTKVARHHHHLPQCYLRGFASGSGKKCKLTVANLRGRRFFETKPRNVGGVRDFNRIEREGLKPDLLEGVLADFEGKVAKAIRNLSDTSIFQGEDRITILNLVALLAVRSPHMRENWRRFEEQVLKQVMDLTLATKERWESTTRSMERDGRKPPHDISYERTQAVPRQ